MELYINHHHKSREDFKIRFGDVDNMHITPFEVKIDNKGRESDIKDELIEMHVDLEAKELFKSNTSSNIEVILILLLSTPSSQQQPNDSYLHTQLHTSLKMVSAM